MNRAILAYVRAGVSVSDPAPVSAARVQEMVGAMHHALFNDATGSYWRMPAEDQAKIGTWDGGAWRWATFIDVVPSPSQAELDSVGVTRDPETGKRDRLLGLFTGMQDEAGTLLFDPPPEIQLFAAEIDAARFDVVDVGNHEIGHLLRMNDEHSNPPLPAAAAAPRSLPAGENPCAVCALDEWLSTSERALFGLRERAHMQHRIPIGLGGRIEEVRQRLERAQAALDRAEALPGVADRHGEVRELRSLITAGQVALDSDHLDPQDISRAHGLVNRAWDASYDLGHSYYVGLLHPGA